MSVCKLREKEGGKERQRQADKVGGGGGVHQLMLMFLEEAHSASMVYKKQG